MSRLCEQIPGCVRRIIILWRDEVKPLVAPCDDPAAPALQQPDDLLAIHGVHVHPPARSNDQRPASNRGWDRIWRRFVPNCPEPGSVAGSSRSGCLFAAFRPDEPRMRSYFHPRPELPRSVQTTSGSGRFASPSHQCEPFPQSPHRRQGRGGSTWSWSGCRLACVRSERP